VKIIYEMVKKRNCVNLKHQTRNNPFSWQVITETFFFDDCVEEFATDGLIETVRVGVWVGEDE